VGNDVFGQLFQAGLRARGPLQGRPFQLLLFEVALSLLLGQLFIDRLVDEAQVNQARLVADRDDSAVGLGLREIVGVDQVAKDGGRVAVLFFNGRPGEDDK